MSMAFMGEHLERIVELGGQALKQEDDFIKRLVLQRSQLQRPFRSRKARFGIRRADNERFFQYLIWRSLLENFEFCVELEREDYYDFVVWGGESGGQIVAVGELKQWVSDTGYPEIPGIQADIKKVNGSEYPGFILLTTAYAPGDLNNQLDFLCPKLAIAKENVKRCTFETFYEGSTDAKEFALLGFMARDSAIV